MHCIYINSFGLVPAYTVTFLMLILMRNYARYGIDTPNQRGFLPPTWEELLLVLLSPKSKNYRHNAYRIEPTTLRSERINQTQTSFGDESVHDLDSAIPATYSVETHKPLGKALFRALGFLESEEELARMQPDDRHLEFPFAPGEYYPRFGVKEAIVTGKKTGSTTDPANTTKKHEETKKNEMDESSNLDFVENVEHSTELELAGPDTKMKLTVLREGNSNDLDTYDSMLGEEYSTDSNHRLQEDDKASIVGGSVDIPGRPSNIVTMQDIDATYEGESTKLTDDLAEVKEKLHELTCHFFNDRTHLRPNETSLPFGKPTSRKKTAEKELEKLLNIGSYSSANPVISRVGLYLTPVVDGVLSFLCVFRALFNVFTWRDPFLSFWVSLVGCGAAIVLFVFPWRLFLFVAGILVVGPQVRDDRFMDNRSGLCHLLWLDQSRLCHCHERNINRCLSSSLSFSPCLAELVASYRAGASWWRDKWQGQQQQQQHSRYRPHPGCTSGNARRPTTLPGPPGTEPSFQTDST